MCKKLIFLFSFVLLLVLAGNAMAQLDPAAVTTGHVYLFEDVSGGQVQDDSANSLAGTIVGNPQVVDGIRGTALQFNGVDDGVNIPDSGNINTGGPYPNRTVVAMFKCDDVDKPGKQTVFEEGGTTRGLTIYVSEGLVYGAAWNRAEYNWDGAWLTAPIESGNWYGVAIVIRDGAEAVEDDKFEMWVNGQLVGKAPGGHVYGHSNDNAIGYTLQNNVFHDGNASPADGHYFEGAIDEIWILNAALTETELGAFVGKVWPYAWGPTPADGALYADTWANLVWTPGGFAVSHDVYLGENFDDVNDGAEGTFQGNQAGTELITGFPGFAYPDGLVPGTTYYWRIDEVNDAEPNSPWKGEIWSFMIPPKTAYDPIPADGTKFAYPDVELAWTGGFSSRLHHVYFGNNFDDVNNATIGLPLTDATYTPGTLELDKVYYWRIDEFDGVATLKGNVWSFRTMPVIPITDPNLVAWWTLDEGSGTAALDWSGHGNHGTFTNDPKWVNGYDGGALQFDGSDDSVIYRLEAEETWSVYTVAVWAKADSLWQSNNSCVFANHMIFATDTPSFQFSFDAVNNYQYHGSVDQIMGPVTTAWVHLAATCDGPTTTLYYNGDLVATISTGAINPVFTKFAIGVNRAEDNWFEGTIDNLRIYDKVLTADEIQQAMRGDPLLAWSPKPNPGSIQYIRDATPLSWSPGDNASEHDVYFGTDENAVADADESDTTGIYRGRQGATSYTPPEGVEWGGGPYYWRIDEYNTDATISKSSVWSFGVADFLGIDDFEDYNTGENQIWYAWKDGLGYGTPGTEPYYAGNGTGSAVGDETTSSYTEETIIHGGGKSMPLFYDNSVLRYSEVEMTLSYPRDWTEEGVGVLSLWFYGDASNAAESLYVAINGNAVVTHNNPNAVLIDEWTEWTIDLQLFADQGVNLANVNTIAIGLGNKKNPVAGGSGTIYIDDIRLLRPLPEPEPEPAP